MAETGSEFATTGFLVGVTLVVVGTLFNVASLLDPVGLAVVLLGTAFVVEALLRG